jgi:PiT family inorganic phosphate transporter
VSFSHGSNDGQKGMGLIMLILIGTVPTAYALNRALPDSQIGVFKAVFAQAAQTLDRYATVPAPADARKAIGDYLHSRDYSPEVVPALAQLTREITAQIDRAGSLRHLAAEATGNVRNDMYLASETTRLLANNKPLKLEQADMDMLKTYRTKLDEATKFIPL